ncbi:MAG: response regulator [Myxococcales bacterium]|nr:response regulator [Myxococcales bacterium]
MLGEREFTTEEIAQMCGVSRPAVVEWVTRGLLPARLTEGGHRRVARSVLAGFLAKQGYRIPRDVARERPLVFVIDDEPIWRATMQRYLEPDFEVQTFGQGVEALLSVGAGQPDIVVVDLHMPGVDSLHLINIIAHSAQVKDCLVVGFAPHEEELSAARRNGAHLAVNKNRASEMQGLLRKLVGEHQRRQHEAGGGASQPSAEARP